MFLIENDIDLLTECDFLKNDGNRPCVDFKNIIPDQNEDYHIYIKNGEGSVFEKTLIKGKIFCNDV